MLDQQRKFRGPLVNSYGEVIGVTNAKITVPKARFAIPINNVKSIIEELINKDTFPSPDPRYAS